MRVRRSREGVYRTNSRGLALMEMVVVLAVITILAAILTPIITSYVERARYDAARSDVRNIATAIVQFNTDTKVWPIYPSSSDIPNGSVYDVEKTPGDPAAVGGGATGWTAPLVTGATSLDLILNGNFLGLSTTGTRAWRGAYLELGSDPWGTAYYVTSGHLRPSSTFAAYVLSAGPNQTIDTPYAQTRAGSLSIGTDDVVQRIR